MAIKGNTGFLQVDADGSGTYSTVAQLTDWTVDVNADQIEVSAMGTANKEFFCRSVFLGPLCFHAICRRRRSPRTDADQYADRG